MQQDLRKMVNIFASAVACKFVKNLFQRFTHLYFPVHVCKLPHNIRILPIQPLHITLCITPGIFQ